MKVGPVRTHAGETELSGGMSEETSKPVVGVPTETFVGEHRVALVPATLRSLTKAGLEVVVESGAGLAAGFSDEQFVEQGLVRFFRVSIPFGDKGVDALSSSGAWGSHGCAVASASIFADR